ncbi:hypothetical protein D3C81_1431740 [compost metagenome]
MLPKHKKIIQESIQRSNKVKIFVERGNEFQGIFYTPLFDANPKLNKMVRILLSDVQNPSKSTN